MSNSLFTLAHLATHEQAFGAVAQRLGFSSAGDIERFLFKAYGKALRKIPAAKRGIRSISSTNRITWAANASSSEGPSNLSFRHWER